jgi:hypothetical protein
MNRRARRFIAAGSLVLVVIFASGYPKAHSLTPFQAQSPTQAPSATGYATPATPPRTNYLKAFVIDDRLSALRREPGLQSEVIRRLRLGRTVYIVSAGSGQNRFCRVAVTRRTRGWIHSSAIAVQGRAGEDQRVMKLIETASDGFDRIGLCRVLLERFGQSRLVARALLLMGEEADRAAETLTQRARKRLAEVQVSNSTRLRDFYLSDAGLDRYSKLHIVFDFNEASAQFVYDGKAYRDIVRRFPEREEAILARQRLELASKKMAGR